MEQPQAFITLSSNKSFPSALIIMAIVLIYARAWLDPPVVDFPRKIS